MHEHNAVRRFRELQRPVERGVATAQNHEILAAECFRVPHAIVNGRAFVLLRLRHAQLARLKRADTGRNDHRARVEARAAARLDVETAVLTLHDRGHFLAEVHAGAERLDLLLQPLDELACRADRHRRNVVNRLVGIQLRALAAGVRERIDDVSIDAEQPKLEHLEQPAGTGTDDHDLGFEDAGGGGDGLAQDGENL